MGDSYNLQDGGTTITVTWKRNIVWRLVYLSHNAYHINPTESHQILKGRIIGIFLLVLMMTSSNRNIFPVTGHLCGEFTGHRWIPRTKASDEELWCFLWSGPEWTVSKQPWGWWFETPSWPLWRHSNVIISNRNTHLIWHGYVNQYIEFDQ